MWNLTVIYTLFGDSDHSIPVKWLGDFVYDLEQIIGRVSALFSPACCFRNISNCWYNGTCSQMCMVYNYCHLGWLFCVQQHYTYVPGCIGCHCIRMCHTFVSNPCIYVFANLPGLRASEEPQAATPSDLLIPTYRPDIVIYNSGSSSVYCFRNWLVPRALNITSMQLDLVSKIQLNAYSY